MARPTDTERGARIALAIAAIKCDQPDLFEDVPDVEFWEAIAEAAALELLASKHLRDAFAASIGEAA